VVVVVVAAVVVVGAAAVEKGAFVSDNDWMPNCTKTKWVTILCAVSRYHDCNK
jgi:hypothetical protein